MKLDRSVKDLLKRAGATLKRSKKHLVFGLPDGKNVVLSHSPSDGNAVHQQIRDIKQHLHIPKEPAKPRSLKTAKPGRHGEPRDVVATVEARPTIREQLRLTGINEKILERRIAQQRETLDALQYTVNRLNRLRSRCPFCRIHDWIQRTFERSGKGVTR